MARTASDEPQLPGLGPITGGSAATMATGDMAGGGAGEEERGPEGPPDNVRSSSPWVALLSLVGGLKPCSSHTFACPEFQRKPRSHVPRAAPSHRWGFKLGPVLPPAPAKKNARKKRTAKKRDRPCALCDATETPLWRTWPTDRRVTLCNACGIRVRTPGVVLPELVYLPHPATATTTVVSELQQPVPPPQEIQPVSHSPGAALPDKVYVHLPPPATATTTVVSELEQPPPEEIQDSESPPDSPILESMIDVDVYLLRRTSPRRKKSPPPPPPPPTSTTEEPAPAAAAPAPGNEKHKSEKWCLHCGTTWTLQWRTGPAGESTLCNACGVRYRQGRLVPEYRPRASPTFNQAEHSYKHREVLKIRKKQDHPAPPAAFKPIRTRKRRKGKGQQQPAQIRNKRKRKRSNDQNQPAQAQPAAVPVLRHAGDEMEQHIPPPPPELPRAADDTDTMAQHLPPPPAQPHAGGELMMDDEPLPPPDPFLFDGPAAPRIIDDDEPWVIVIDDD
ncbi:unnamed protein product [Miscanthus lutarioriparius]|uniref:GATA-type domain-containing protein n=1 Tax=Miscanthus lutarioriparius TaxID=422564 RepID=A0A811RDE4_9POAL|nr:unnamed protein product [Miscanthus lutarioriparius]